TRDYIPRVLAFTTIYNYLLNRTQPEVSVARISGRMPPPDRAIAAQPKPAAATVACPVADVASSETR
ncbi:MAG TPA: hypothetical protein VFG52_11645, partial [Xanthomonadales bacterium]|nr:hypothetical protein [Xanthomonadales bacterium]